MAEYLCDRIMKHDGGRGDNMWGHCRCRFWNVSVASSWTIGCWWDAHPRTTLDAYEHFHLTGKWVCYLSEWARSIYVWRIEIAVLIKQPTVQMSIQCSISLCSLLSSNHESHEFVLLQIRTSPMIFLSPKSQESRHISVLHLLHEPIFDFPPIRQKSHSALSASSIRLPQHANVIRI